MSELQTLTKQRDDILAKIREIEESCEGIENENNAERVQELNLQLAHLTSKKAEITAQLSAITTQLSAISAEITKISGKGIDRILEAIKNQRWYFFKNNTKILMDRDTGVLWANLNYFNWCPDTNDPETGYHLNEAIDAVTSYVADEFTEWIIPRFDDFKKMIRDKTFPFHTGDTISKSSY